MTKPIPTWPSSDGLKFHTDYLEYVKYEMFLWFFKATGDNKPAAQSIVDKLIETKIGEGSNPTDQVDHLRTLLNDVSQHVLRPVQYELTEIKDTTPTKPLQSVA